jgi:hypothetical protein
MGDKGEVILPSCSSAEGLTNKFGDFFTNKIKNIRDGLQSSATSADIMNADVQFVGTPLQKFSPATEDEVRKLVMGAANKSPCDLDPLPTWLLKQCINVLLPLITAIINCMFTQ